MSQTYTDIEIILIDDGSDDKSFDVISEYAQNNKRIKIIKQKNSGVSVARNAGIKAAKGDWLVFIDSDDYIDIDYCENLYNEYIRTGHATIVCGYTYENVKKTANIIPTGKSIDSISDFSHIIGEFIDNKIFLSLWGKAYNLNTIHKKNIMLTSGVSLGEDLLFNLLYFQEERSFTISQNNGYHYTQLNNPNSLSKAPSLKRLENSKLIYEKAEEFCNKLNISKTAMPYFAKYYIKNIMYTFDLLTNSTDYQKITINNEMLKIVRNNTTKKALKHLNKQDAESILYYYLLTPGRINPVRALSSVRKLTKAILR